VSPRYEVRAWQEDSRWLARVVSAADDADPAPLNAVTQARSLSRVEAMARDLVATILDADESKFDVDVEYVLPGVVASHVDHAKDARALLDIAGDLWHEQSAAAALVLTGEGYSLRETAALLGLSHQRVDQILSDTAPAGDWHHSETRSELEARFRTRFAALVAEAAEHLSRLAVAG
jgi:hypothetical protein